MKRPSLAMSVLLAVTAVALTAAAKLESIGASDVSFQAVGPAGLKINGTGALVTAKEEGGAIKFKAPLGSLKTGIGLRDGHLKKYLNVAKHPHATLSVKRSSLKFPDDNETADGTATGDFTLNGVTKPAEFSYKAKRTGSDYHVQGLTTIDITKFKIEQPCYLGVCVDPEVKVKVRVKLRDK